MQEKIKTYINNNRELLFGIFFVSCFIVFFIVRKNVFDKAGVFTIAKLLKYESDASGSSLYIEIYFDGKKINTVVNSSCFGCDSSKFYYVKILPGNPKYDVILLEESPVPDCILEKEIPVKGWSKMPTCK